MLSPTYVGTRRSFFFFLVSGSLAARRGRPGPSSVAPQSQQQLYCVLGDYIAQNFIPGFIQPSHMTSVGPDPLESV